MKLKSNEEIFWAGNFGDKYTKRNSKSSNRTRTIGRELLKNKIKLSSAFEIGTNVGFNLDALKNIYPKIKTYGVELNRKSYNICKKKHQCFNKSLLDFDTKKKFDLVFTSGVLIHQNPKYLKVFYKKLYKFSLKYIYIAEYFNPTPVTVKYRGHDDKLYKRDFAKEIWDTFPNLKLIDYGFHWKFDPYLKHNCDDANWFLFKK